jgi:hypothetical protein
VDARGAAHFKDAMGAAKTKAWVLKVSWSVSCELWPFFF